MKRREFIVFLGGSAAAWPLTARAQQATQPVVAFINVGSPELRRDRVATFGKGLSETGYTQGQNVSVEYHWLDGTEDQTARLPLLVADLLRRQVALLVGNTPSALAAKAATTRVPIVFVDRG
jgi:ABC-type uncharacterized transport system substrate-binding protein